MKGRYRYFWKYLPVAVASIVLVGCDMQDRLSRLEKQNQELQAEIKKRDGATADLESQAKCSRDAKVWFRENWPSDRTTLLLDYTNHYNKTRNQCFTFV